MTPKKATVPYVPKFQEYAPPTHLRQDEIDRQPRPVSMSAVGNGGNNGMGRGT